jgi:hypothetical protein
VVRLTGGVPQLRSLASKEPVEDLRASGREPRRYRSALPFLFSGGRADGDAARLPIRAAHPCELREADGAGASPRQHSSC